MTGLEQIIETILADTKLTCEGLVADAKIKAEEIMAAAKTKADRKAEDIVSLARAEAGELIKRTESSVRLDYGKRLLSERVALIDEVLTKALERLYALSDREYLKVLETMALQYAQPEAGVMLLSPKDMGRLDKDFEARLNAGLAKKGALLSVAARDGLSGGGFVLVYGHVEHNCTFPALLAASRDELKDLVYSKLFG